MPRYRQRQTGQDGETRQAGPSDFLNVENRRREHFPEEFAEGPYGAPVLEADAPAGPELDGGAPFGLVPDDDEIASRIEERHSDQHSTDRS